MRKNDISFCCNPRFHAFNRQTNGRTDRQKGDSKTCICIRSRKLKNGRPISCRYLLRHFLSCDTIQGQFKNSDCALNTLITSMYSVKIKKINPLWLLLIFQKCAQFFPWNFTQRKFHAKNMHALLKYQQNSHGVTSLCLPCSSVEQHFWNNFYRQIFIMHYWESLQYLQLFSDGLDSIHVVYIVFLTVCPVQI